MLSEISQTQKDNGVRSHLYVESEIDSGKQSRVVVASG